MRLRPSVRVVLAVVAVIVLTGLALLSEAARRCAEEGGSLEGLGLGCRAGGPPIMLERDLKRT